MRTGDKKIFIDQDKLYQLVNLRFGGYSISSLAYIFSCDPSSIRNQCDKYNVVPLEGVYTIERLASSILHEESEDSIWASDENGIVYNKGRTYQEYLDLSRYPHIKRT